VAQAQLGSTARCQQGPLRRCAEAQANFPFQTRGRIMAPVLLTQLAAPSEPAALHAVVMSFDGYLYMIDGASGAMTHSATALPTL